MNPVPSQPLSAYYPHAVTRYGDNGVSQDPTFTSTDEEDGPDIPMTGRRRIACPILPSVSNSSSHSPCLPKLSVIPDPISMSNGIRMNSRGYVSAPTTADSAVLNGVDVIHTPGTLRGFFHDMHKIAQTIGNVPTTFSTATHSNGRNRRPTLATTDPKTMIIPLHYERIRRESNRALLSSSSFSASQPSTPLRSTGGSRRVSELGMGIESGVPHTAPTYALVTTVLPPIAKKTHQGNEESRSVTQEFAMIRMPSTPTSLRGNKPIAEIQEIRQVTVMSTEFDTPNPTPLEPSELGRNNTLKRLNSTLRQAVPTPTVVEASKPRHHEPKEPQQQLVDNRARSTNHRARPKTIEGLNRCTYCERQFQPDRIDRHQAVCRQHPKAGSNSRGDPDSGTLIKNLQRTERARSNEDLNAIPGSRKDSSSRAGPNNAPKPPATRQDTDNADPETKADRRRPKTVEGLCRCTYCERQFQPDRIDRHQAVCQQRPKTDSELRKSRVKDGKSMRVKGTEFEAFQSQSSRRGNAASGRSKSNSRWRQQHEEFIRAIRAAREPT